MKTLTELLRFIPVLPLALLSYILGFLSILLFLTSPKSLRFEGFGIMTLEWREWFSKGRDNKGFWSYSTTIWRVIFWRPGRRSLSSGELEERIERHERIHIWQIEDLMLVSLLVGLFLGFKTDDWICAVVVWISGGIWQLTNFVTALLRFGPYVPRLRFLPYLSKLISVAYRDSEHERSAYAQTNTYSNGENFWDLQDQKRSK